MRTRLVRIGWSLGLAALAMSCDSDPATDPADAVDPPPLTVTVLDMHRIRISWESVPSAQGYVLQRRANLEGTFEVVEELESNVTSYVDRNLQPNTIYGYKLEVLGEAGSTVGATTVASGQTPPEPGVEVSLVTVLGGSPDNSIDSTGYTITLTGGGEDLTADADVNSAVLFEQLAPGTYTAALSEVASQCTVQDGPSRTVQVTGQGLNTIAKVRFDITCRDRTRGLITAHVLASGDTTDPNGFDAVLSGLASDATLPPSERAVVIRRSGTGAGAGQDLLFDNLRPGTYSLVLEGVSPVCATQGGEQRSNLAVDALSSLREEFLITCTRPGGDEDLPYTFRAAWLPDTAPAGTEVRLAVSLDLRQDPSEKLGAYQFTLETPSSVVRLDSVKAAGTGWSLTLSPAAPGRFTALATRAFTDPATGLVPLLNGYYTVVGSAGQLAPVTITGLELAAPDASTSLLPKTHVQRDTFTIGTKSGIPGNDAPTAKLNGPYTGTSGAAVNFSSAGSFDPDGTIVSYFWEFGDGGSVSGESPTHIYQAPGAFTVTLTVTDNRGATGTAQAPVTITGPLTTPLVWKTTFGAYSAIDQTVPLTLSLDLTPNLPETPTTERLATWVVDSLVWDPAVLKFYAFDFGSGTGTVDVGAVSRGVLRFSGTVAASKSTGVVPIARVVLKAIAGVGKTSSSKTFLGPIRGTPVTGSYDYMPRIRIEEGSFTIPGVGTGTSVAGQVTSQTGPLSGVVVTLSPGGRNATTGSNGKWTVPSVAPGSYSAVVSGLPSTCTAPAPVPVTVGNSAVTGVDITVTCTQAPSGATVSGTVTSPQLGALGGVTITVSGGFAAVTAGTGMYSVTDVADGPRTVSVSAGLPSNCTAPAPQNITVAGGAVTGIDFSVDCPGTPPPTGTVSGSITFAAGSQTPSLAGVTVTVTPAGGAALTTNPTAAGQYTRSGLAVGTGSGTVAVSTLPAGCTAAQPTVNYTGLTAGSTVTAPAIPVNCPAAPPADKYPFTVTWSAPQGGQITMTAKIDMGAINDPANNGAGPDVIGALQATLTVGSRVTMTGASQCSGQSGFSATFNVASNVLGILLVNTTGASGMVSLFTCTFAYSAAGTTTLTGTGLLFGDNIGAEFTPKVNVSLSPIP